MAVVIPTRVRAAVSGYAKLLREHLGTRVKDVRLFGSWARGDANGESDVDVFVLLDTLDERTRLLPYELCDTILFRDEIDLSPTIMSDREWKHLLGRERRIALDILREGVAF